MIQEKTIICVIALTGLLLFSNTKVTAQSDFKVGGGVSYGILTDALGDSPASIGIQGEGIYSFSDNFRSSLDVAFFFGDEDKGIDNWLTFNANVHYLFSSEGVKPYLLAGVNFISLSFAGFDGGDFGFNDPGNGSGSVNFSSGGGGASDSSIGLNTGAGLEFTTDFGDIFIESGFAISDASQFKTNAGVRFDI